MLSSPRLRRIIAAYTINRLGTWFGLVALSLAVFDHTHSALAVAALLVRRPGVAGVRSCPRSSRGSRRPLAVGELSGLYFFEAAATAALAVLLWHFWLPAVLLLAALDGTAALAASALLRAEVGGSHASAQTQLDVELAADERSAEAEQKANAALNVAFSGAFVLGPAIGGAAGRRPPARPPRCSSTSARS